MTLESILFGYFDNLQNQMRTSPLNLGGVMALSGGSGGPPGGFIGSLPQSKISYDLSEDARYDIIDGSNPTLVDNLNRIRYMIANISGGGGSGGGGWVAIQNNEVEVDPEVTVIDFQNNLKATSQSEGNVGVKVVGTTTESIPIVGSGEDKEFVEDYDNLSFDLENKILFADKLGLGRRDYVPIYENNAPKIYTVGEDGELASNLFLSFGDGTTAYPIINMIGAEGTAAEPLASSGGDILAAFVGRGRGESNYASGSRARVYLKTNQDWTDDNQGTKFEVQLTPDDSTTPQTILSATTALVEFDEPISVGGLIVKTIEIDPTGANIQDVLAFDGSKFVPMVFSGGQGGGGDMYKSVYDPDEDGIIGIDQGGTETDNVHDALHNFGLGDVDSPTFAGLDILGNGNIFHADAISGYIGIWKSDPEYPLDINTDTNFRGYTYFGGIEVDFPSTDTGNVITFDGSKYTAAPPVGGGGGCVARAWFGI